MAYKIGQHIGNYRLIRFLGWGGFAEVYLGEQVYLQTQAALKLLHIHPAAEALEDFLHEAQTIAHLEHPHIVPVLDFGVQEGIPFLVMRYAPRGTLRTLHPKGTQLSMTVILSYVRQLASALHYAHEQKVIHRDVKPENMLIGQHDEVLLSDFGLAIAVPTSQQSPLLSVAGTMPYMAPEQLQGKPCPASDQYALGVVIYEWFCGALPFTGSEMEIAVQHLKSPPAPIREKVPALSSEVEGVVLRALAKDPTHRFVTVEAFANAMEQAIQSEGSGHGAYHMSSQAARTRIAAFIGRRQQRPLVGRTDELATLRQIISKTEQSTTTLHANHTKPDLSWSTPSHPSCVVLFGEAGIGKTRLVEEVSREAQNRGWSVLWSRAYIQERSMPYQAWIELLRMAFNQGIFPLEEMNQHPHLYQPLTALLPELVDHFPQDGAAPAVDRESEQLHLWEAILALLKAMSEHCPLLLVLDDLHWIDHSSQEMLAFLGRRLHRYPIMIIGTCRNDDVSITHPLRLLLTNLQQEHVLLKLPIVPLADAHIGDLIAYASPDLVPSIQRQAAGNPFFAEELAHVSTTDDQGRSVLPETITAALDLRLGSLSPECQQFLRTAALLGNSFIFEVISLLEMRSTLTHDVGNVLTLLEEALHAGVLTEEVVGTHVTYHFKHPLLVNHLFNRISAGRRVVLHRHTAEILRHVYGTSEDEWAATIVHHLMKGEAASQEIARYAELAADRAYALSAYTEAEQYYRLALAYTEKIKGTGPIGTQEDERYHVVYLLEQLGECSRIVGNHQEARRIYGRILEERSLFSPATSPVEKRHAALTEALLWRDMAVTWFDSGDVAQAQQCCIHGEQILCDSGVAGGSVWAEIRLEQGYAYWRDGNNTEASRMASEALHLFEEALRQEDQLASPAPRITRSRRTLTGNPVNPGYAHVLLGNVANSMGHLSEALSHYKMALALFEQHACQREIANTTCNMGDLYLKKAEYELAQAAFQRSLALAEQIGDIPLLCVVYANLGTVAVRSGDLKEAEGLLKQSLTLAEQTNERVYLSLFHTVLASVLHDQGKLPEAGGSIHHALALGRAINSTPCIGSALVSLGRMRLAQALVTHERETDMKRQDTIPSAKGASQNRAHKSARFLQQARKTLQRGLTMEGLEAEARTEGHLALAQVFLLLGELKTAQQQVIYTLEQAQEQELANLSASAQRLLGSILFAQGLKQQAIEQFEQASSFFRKRGMRLEYARTLQGYGVALLQEKTSVQENAQRGFSYLREAHQTFLVCHAALDLQVIEDIFPKLGLHLLDEA